MTMPRLDDVVWGAGLIRVSCQGGYFFPGAMRRALLLEKSYLKTYYLCIAASVDLHSYIVACADLLLVHCYVYISVISVWHTRIYAFAYVEVHMHMLALHLAYVEVHTRSTHAACVCSMRVMKKGRSAHVYWRWSSWICRSAQADFSRWSCGEFATVGADCSIWMVPASRRIVFCSVMDEETRHNDIAIIAPSWNWEA